MTTNLDFFKFATKIGSLEGYLYQREKLEDLTDWVNNIETMYPKLSPQVKKDIKEELRFILNKILGYGAKTVKPEQKKKLKAILDSL